MLYSEADLENSMSKIETINFHQEIEMEGIKFWCYHGSFFYCHLQVNVFFFLYLNMNNLYFK